MVNFSNYAGKRPAFDAAKPLEYNDTRIRRERQVAGENFVTNMIVMPTRVGAAIANGTAQLLPTMSEVLLATFTNVAFTGYAFNVMASKPGGAPFGYTTSLVAQVLYGFLAAENPGTALNQSVYK